MHKKQANRTANRSVLLQSNERIQTKLEEAHYDPILKKSVNSSLSQNEFRRFLQSRSQTGLQVDDKERPVHGVPELAKNALQSFSKALRPLKMSIRQSTIFKSKKADKDGLSIHLPSTISINKLTQQHLQMGSSNFRDINGEQSLMESVSHDKS